MGAGIPPSKSVALVWGALGISALSLGGGRSFELPIKGKSGTHRLYEVVGLNYG